MTIGDKIKILRENLGMSQEELAKSINTIKQTIYKYENNLITNIPSDKIEKMAVKLYTTPAYLMGWDETPTTTIHPLTPEETKIGQAYGRADPPIQAIVKTALAPYMPDESKNVREFPAAPEDDFELTDEEIYNLDHHGPGKVAALKSVGDLYNSEVEDLNWLADEIIAEQGLE